MFRRTAAPTHRALRPISASLLLLLAGAPLSAASPEPASRRHAAATDSADPVASVQTAGRLDSVTVYRGQALVSRVIDLDGAPGLREIVVTDLPERIIAASLFAEAIGEGGGGGAEIRSVRFRARPVSQDVREEVRKIDEQARALQDKIKAADAAAGLIAQHTAYLGKLQEFVAPTAQTELKSGVLNAETIERLSRFQFEERQKLLDRSLALEIEKRSLAEQMELLQRQRATLAGSSSRTVREAVVFVNVPERGGGVKAGGIALRYLVDHANWSPSYNVRAAIDARKVGVDYYASIEQMTGEDWSGVSMTLSTATPTLAAKAPVLAPMSVHLASLGENAQAQPQPAGTFKDYAVARNEFGSKRQQLDAQRRQAEVWRDVRPGATVAAEADAESFDKAINRVAGDEQLFDLASNINVDRAASKKLVEDRPGEGVTVTYSLPSRTSLPSRADRQLIQVASVEMDGSFYKLATPVLSEYVYNEAGVTNTSDLVLLEGPVATYVAGQFVGRGQIPTVAAGETFTLGLGIDPSLRASRRLAQRTETLQGGNRVIESAYELALENFGNAAATVRLVDRLPTMPAASGGTGSEIKVTLLPPSAQSGHATSDDPQYLAGPAKQGILRWDLDVPAKSVDVRAARLEYRFQLEFDKQRTIAAGSGVGGMAAK